MRKSGAYTVFSNKNCREAVPTSLEFWRMRASNQYPADAPGVPCDEDLRPFAKYAEQLRRAETASGKPGLLLGATRQTADWCRENGLRVTMMDFCEAVAWDFASTYKEWEGLEIILDNWLTTAHADNSFSWAAGDGVINAVGPGRNANHLFRQLRRLLLPGSIAILRHMLRSSPTPALSEVFAKLAMGGIHSFGAFRHQISHSVQSSFMDGVATRAVYRVLLESGVLDNDPKGRFGWPADQLARLEYWAIEGASLCYPTIEELRDLTETYFEELEISHGDYEMAGLSPTIVYRTRPDSKNL